LARNIIPLTSLTSSRKAYGFSADFFSFFLSCSRRSACVKKENDDASSDADGVTFAGLLDLPFFGTGSSSSSSSSSDNTDGREEEEAREEDDLVDLLSSSDSDGTMKSSSSSEAFEDFRPDEM
jgi:hypothetical protein